jgi:sulfite reductase alpha subunit-like flavoprotein
VLEVLQDFPSADPPLARLLESGPSLQPRRFSIASSPSAHPGEAHLLVAVVRWTTPFKRQKSGLCSAWLASLAAPGSGGGGGAGEPPQLPVWVEAGALRLPPPSTPLILVGPGTGVAPLRSFLQERAVQRAAAAAAAAAAGGDPAAAAAAAVAPAALFFGCRAPGADYYYRRQWEGYAADGTLAELSVAFSRPPGGGPKAYVTQRLRERGAQVWALLAAGAAVFISGSARSMPTDVAAAFRDVAHDAGGLSAEAAAAFVRSLELSGRWNVEAWS